VTNEDRFVSGMPVWLVLDFSQECSMLMPILFAHLALPRAQACFAPRNERSPGEPKLNRATGTAGELRESGDES